MVDALADLDHFQSNNALTSAELADVADVNGDGSIDSRDPQALISTVANSAASESVITSVPEPASCILMATLLVPMALGGRRSHPNQIRGSL